VKLINNVPNGNTYSGILKTDTDTGLFFGSKNGNLKTEISRLSVMIDSTRYYIGFIDKSQNNDIVINDSLTLPECGETEIDVEEILHFYKPSGLFVSNLAEDSVFIYEKLFDGNLPIKGSQYLKKFDFESINISLNFSFSETPLNFDILKPLASPL
jgi:hypothetical protein